MDGKNLDYSWKTFVVYGRINMKTCCNANFCVSIFHGSLPNHNNHEFLPLKNTEPFTYTVWYLKAHCISINSNTIRRYREESSAPERTFSSPSHPFTHTHTMSYTPTPTHMHAHYISAISKITILTISCAHAGVILTG